jgi:hypothetical protein
VNIARCDDQIDCVGVDWESTFVDLGLDQVRECGAR